MLFLHILVCLTIPNSYTGFVFIILPNSVFIYVLTQQPKGQLYIKHSKRKLQNKHTRKQETKQDNMYHLDDDDDDDDDNNNNNNNNNNSVGIIMAI
jgi:hypothetical protein